MGEIEKVQMKQCNFSIPASVYEDYRNFCKSNGIKMNFPISIFMQQFSRGQFNFVFQNCGDHCNFLGVEVDNDHPLTLSDNGIRQVEKIFARLGKKTE